MSESSTGAFKIYKAAPKPRRYARPEPVADDEAHVSRGSRRSQAAKANARDAEETA